MNKKTYSFQPIGAEAITLADAKNFLRVDQSDDDTLVAALITAARSSSEKYLNRLIVQTTVRVTLDWLPRNGITLDYGPVQTVTSITTIASDGTSAIWDPANYIVDYSSGRIAYADSAAFPDDVRSFAGVQVEYVAGYGQLTDVSPVPGSIVQGMRHLLSAMHNNRETDAALPPLVCALLSPFKKFAI